LKFHDLSSNYGTTIAHAAATAAITSKDQRRPLRAALGARVLTGF
jgi:hypothetical protein